MEKNKSYDMKQQATIKYMSALGCSKMKKQRFKYKLQGLKSSYRIK